MMSERRMTTIRLFGVDIAVEDQNHHHHHSPSQTDHQAMIAIEESSRKRKSMTTRSPNQEEEDEDSSLVKKPKILRLFGVDIPIDHLLLTQENQHVPQNTNQEAAPAPIPPHFDYEEEVVPAHDRLERNLVFLFEKELTNSDIGRGHNRLLITKNRSLMAALTEEEKTRVKSPGADFLRVMTEDPNGVEYKLHLKRWNGSGAIVLKHEWGKLVCANGLQAGDSVQGWGYRRSGQFCLVLDIVRN